MHPLKEAAIDPSKEAINWGLLPKDIQGLVPIIHRAHIPTCVNSAWGATPHQTRQSHYISYISYDILRFRMISYDFVYFIWFPIISYDFPVISYDFSWFPMIFHDLLRFLMISYDFLYVLGFLMISYISYDFLWFPMISCDSQGFTQGPV